MDQLKNHLKTWITPKAEIHHSRIGGKGLFAKENIMKGERVVIWGGVYTDKKDAMQKLAKNKDLLVMQWDDNLFSVETRGSDDGYFINHSCEGDLWMDDAYTLSARKNIRKGEEITADYALWETDKNYISHWRCNCGNKNCRGQVTGRDWQLKTLQEKYRKHFSPLINKLIQKQYNT